MLGGAHTAEGTSLREEFQVDEGPNAFLGSQDGLKGYCRGGVSFRCRMAGTSECGRTVLRNSPV